VIQGKTPLMILALTLFLMAVGLTMVYSASANRASRVRRVALKQANPEAYARSHNYHAPDYLKRQAVHAGLGLLVLLIMSSLDHDRLRRLSPWILGLAFVLLVWVFIPPFGGHRINGAYRWLQFGPLRVQPSEFAKLAIVLYMAKMLVDRQRVLQSFRRGVLPASALTGLLCLVIVVEPDFGATAILAMVVFLLWFIAGMRLLHLAALVGMVLPVAALGIIKSPYRLARVNEWLQVLIHGIEEKGQVSQSIITAGSGGLNGLGLGESIMKYSFLLEAHTDFIFAVMAEELGFIRSAIVVLVYLALILLGWIVAMRAADSYGGYLASGITLLLGISVSLNLLVVLGYLPPKGLALPFMSYGGSSLLVNCAAIGILINIAKYTEDQRKPLPRRHR
jgi:cell division protein FtsW